MTLSDIVRNLGTMWSAGACSRCLPGRVCPDVLQPRPINREASLGTMLGYMSAIRRVGVPA